MSGQVENKRIWSHFQNGRCEVFAQARPRHDFLVTRVIRIARRSRASEVSILNIGVGDGYFERRLQSLGFAITGLDPDEKSIGGLRNAGIGGVVATLPTTGLPSESFNIIVASEVIEHLSEEDLQPSVSEVARLLKRGGEFIGTVPYKESLTDGAVFCPACGATFHRWGHQQSFDSRRMHALLERELDVKRLEVRAFVDFAGRSLAGKIRAAIRVVAGHFGYALAAPSLFFQSVKN